MVKYLLTSISFLSVAIFIGYGIGFFLEIDHLLRIIVAVPYSLFATALGLIFFGKLQKKHNLLSILFLCIACFSFMFLCLFVVSTAGTPAWHFSRLQKIIFSLIIIYLVAVFLIAVVIQNLECS
jgi:hypothetical protein